MTERRLLVTYSPEIIFSRNFHFSEPGSLLPAYNHRTPFYDETTTTHYLR